VKSYLESLQTNGKTIDIGTTLAALESVSDELILVLPPTAIGKLLYLLNNLNDNDANLISNDEALSQRRIAIGFKLVSTFSTRKGYLIALQHYQPLTEYDQVKAEDSIDALWHNDQGIFADEYNQELNGLYSYVNELD
ncbi:hypothetical protein AB9G22_09155, partial [Francisella philomiragia]